MESLKIKAECEYCNKKSDVCIHINQNKFIGFSNRMEQNSDGIIPDTQEIFQKWKKEGTFTPVKAIDFNTQPFKVGKTVDLNGKQMVVNKVFRTEWTEKDLDIRIEHPRPDAYWYEVKDENNKIKWLKVENVVGENIFLSEDGIIVLDNSESIEELSDNPSKIKNIFKSDCFGGRKIEAYQYVNGVRAIVVNHKEQIEMDIFEDTFEDAMAVVEENMELNVFNE
jgi:hypothetical protein